MGSHRRKGQAAVEMALLAPLLFIFMFCGVIDFGFGFYRLMALQHAAHQAAKWAAEKRNGNVTTTDIVNYLTDTDRPKLPAWWFSSDPQQGRQIQPTINTSLVDGSRVFILRLSYLHPLYTPFYQRIYGGRMPLATTAAFQIPRGI